MDKQDKPKVVPITNVSNVSTFPAGGTVSTTPANEQYGVFNTYDCLWMGNDKGPLLYATRELAEVACGIADVVLDWPMGRCRARVYTGGATKLRDTLKTVCSGAEAIDRLEKGEISG